MVKKEVLLSPYSVTLWIIMTKDPHGDVTRLNLKNKGLNIKWDGGAAAYTHDFIYNEHVAVVIFDKEHIDLDTIAHEAVHIKNLVFKHSGIKHDYSNDEPEAYFLGWLISELYKQSKLKK